LGHPSKFQRVSRLAFVPAATSLTGGQPKFARRFSVSWAGTLYIQFRGLLPPDGILPGAKFTLHPSLAFSYIGSVTPRHSSSERQPNLHRGSRNGITELSHRAPPIFGLAAITWASAHILVFGRAFVKRFARCYQTVVCPVLCCPVCLSVTLVYCGQTVRWIKIKLGTQVGLDPGHTVLDGDPAPLPIGVQP